MRTTILIFLLFIIIFPAFNQETDLNILKAKVLYSQGKYQESIELLSEPGSNEKLIVFKLLGDCFYKLNNTENALKYYLVADSLEKGFTTYEISRCYAALNKPEKAFLWLEKNLTSTKKRSEAEINFDKAFASIISSPEWKKFWQKEWYSTSDLLKTSIYSYLKSNNASSALDVLDKNEKIIYPKHEYNALRAQTFIQMNLWESANTSINNAIELNKRSDEYFIIRARISKELNKLEQSISDYTRAIKLNPYEISYYSERAEIFILNKNFTGAEEDIKVIENTSSMDEATLLLLAKLKNLKEDYREAIKYYGKLIALGTPKPEYYMERGNIELYLEDYQKADYDYSIALDKNPYIPEAYLNKGKIQLYLMDSETACYYFEKAKNFGNKEAAKLFIDHCLIK